ncbi:MAG: GNAT family N-acetyltransferase [Deltaproteobacteria bacterium]|nr:GNAT family N-acetyltransferase [Deltaproteobacteria bacterium]
MNDRYLIRPALEHEVDALARMRLNLQAHMMKSNPNLWNLSQKKISALADNYRNELKKDTSSVLVVYDPETNRIIGMGMGRIFAHDEYIPDKSGKIDDIWIDTEHRRNGLCTALLQELVSFFESHAVQFIGLDWVVGNAEAEATWTSMGFKPNIISSSTKLDDLKAKLT